MRGLSASSPACHGEEQSDEAISRPRLPRSLRSLAMTRAALAMTTRQWMGWREEGGEDLGPLAGGEDEIGNFAYRALAAFLLADEVDGFEDGWHGVGRGRREPHGAKGFEIIDVVTDVSDLIEREAVFAGERGEHRQLVVNSLVHLRHCQLLTTPLHDRGLLPGDEGRDQASRLEQLDPH